METYVIFLRGVMPTGKNKVPMAELRMALTNAGLHEVRTYIQSGNVLARSELSAQTLQSLVHDVIVHDIGANIDVMVRTHEQTRYILHHNPFPLSAASRTYFSILAHTPDEAFREKLLHLDFSPDQIHLIDDTLYTLYATQHSDSKFNNNFFERHLHLRATTRNFNTLTNLVSLGAELGVL